jgi:ferrous iron transport protein B
MSFEPPVASGAAPGAASAVALPRAAPLIAIAGNPNVGKTTLFNRLTGSEQKVGNYPGVTVESHTGRLVLGGTKVDVVDVPGTYSLSARSREEQIAIQAVAGLGELELPDLVVVVVDATQLSRNLYLVLQVIELDLPVVVALNMIDELERDGRTVDAVALERELGVPVASLSALGGRGLDDLRKRMAVTLAAPERARPGWRWRPATPELAEDIEAVSGVLPRESSCRRRWIRSS